MPDIELAKRLTMRLGDLHMKQTTCPPDSEIGAVHEIEETSTGYLPGTLRQATYAGNGRWEVYPGCYTLWHESKGAVRFWSDVRESLVKRALAALSP